MTSFYKRAELKLLFLSFSYLLVCATLGVGLELLLAYKSPFLFGPENETRRLLLRLGHAHGSLLTLFSMLWLSLGERIPGSHPSALGRLYLLSAVLMGSGFFLAGLTANERDPGLIIVFVPIGAGLFLLSLILSARSVLKALRREAPPNE